MFHNSLLWNRCVACRRFRNYLVVVGRIITGHYEETGWRTVASFQNAIGICSVCYKWFWTNCRQCCQMPAGKLLNTNLYRFQRKYCYLSTSLQKKEHGAVVRILPFQKPELIEALYIRLVKVSH